MARSITKKATRENLAIKQTFIGIQGNALYQRVCYLFGHLFPSELACLYLFTIGVFRKKSRALIYTMWLVVCPKLFKKRFVPSVAINSLISNTVSLRLYEQTMAPGNVTLEELFVL